MLYKNRSHQILGALLPRDVPYELTHNMLGKAVENSKSHTTLLYTFIVDHQYILVQELIYTKGYC